MVLYVAIKVKRKKKKEGALTNGNAEHAKREELSLPLGEARSAKSRRSARRNWLRLVTTMRGVEINSCQVGLFDICQILINSCQGIFLKDSYRRVRYSEEDLAAELRGEYVVDSHHHHKHHHYNQHHKTNHHHHHQVSMWCTVQVRKARMTTMPLQASGSLGGRPWRRSFNTTKTTTRCWHWRTDPRCLPLL